MLQNLKCTKTNADENVTCKGSNKANAHGYKAIRNICYAVVITLAFFFTFPGITNRFHIVQVWQPLKIQHNTHNHTNTHEN